MADCGQANDAGGDNHAEIAITAFVVKIQLAFVCAPSCQ
jgi:hypothetical protein